MKNYLIILFCLISASVIAEQRTEAELCKIAQNVLPQSVKERHLIRSNNGKIELLSPKILYRTNALSFVGYSEGGFVVLSNESTNEAVLGYSETCMPDTLPDGMQWWVDAMNSVLTDKTNIRRTPITAPHKIVEPLIETAWAQGFHIII
ncbi:MAG: Spi family protease inhibitor [Paludibacteraceae bacterium]|nr:Spi family protease inhibitor [Paludibacteraceae bacterium]